MSPLTAIVTRPRAQARPLVERLEAAGVEVVECPLIEIEHTSDDAIDATGYDWLVVTSSNGADEVAQRGRNLPRVAAVGPGTAEALRSHGIEPDFVPRVSSQEGLVAEFPRPPGRVLFAAPAGARSTLSARTSSRSTARGCCSQCRRTATSSCWRRARRRAPTRRSAVPLLRSRSVPRRRASRVRSGWP